MVFLLLVAGHETTVNLIGNGVLALLEHPDQMERLRDDPALIKPAVEELLRYASPLETATERYAREDVTVAGVTIPRGALVFAVLASANRDERQFPDPDALDITREPNRHLAFGLGPHFCLGAPLARLEGQVAIGTLLPPRPDLRLAVPPGALRWRRGLVLRGSKRCRWPCPGCEGIWAASLISVEPPYGRAVPTLGRFPMSPRVPVGERPRAMHRQPLPQVQDASGTPDRACFTRDSSLGRSNSHPSPCQIGIAVSCGTARMSPRSASVSCMNSTQSSSASSPNVA